MTIQPWFADAKLGIFVHWGIYAVNGIPESWSFYNGEITYENYMKQLDGFTASAYDAGEWARLFKASGARYAVLTAKHHDGVALWDTAENDLNVVKGTPAGRDLLAPYAQAMRDAGLKVGIYFSHLDWSHPDYPFHTQEEFKAASAASAGAAAADSEAWARFLKFHRAQLKEIVEGYRPDLLWFDGDWELPEEQWRMAELREQLTAMKADMVFNSRLLGHGDYATPEQGAPITPPEGPWELCYTVNNSWGFQTHDHDHKPLSLLVRTFVETIAGGGNLLLDVGPRADGSIPSEQTSRLEALGQWIRRNEPAVYDTTRGIPAGHVYAPTTVSTDRRTLYVFCYDPPRHPVTIKGLTSRVKRVTALAGGEELTHRRYGGFGPVPGVLAIDAPSVADPVVTVLAIELDGEVELYRGAGRD